MTLDIGRLFSQAASTPEFSVAGEAAKAVCYARDQHPFDVIPTGRGYLNRWQAVIFEQSLMSALGACMMGQP